MKKLLIFIFMTAGSTLGWYAGAYFGEFWFPLFVSGLLSFVGVIVGWKIGRMYE